MTLEEKMLTINAPSIAEIPNVGVLPTGTADTIEIFFTTFVKDRLPKSDVIKHWHKLLMEYTRDLTRLSCCVRFGNNGTKKLSSLTPVNILISTAPNSAMQAWLISISQ